MDDIFQIVKNEGNNNIYLIRAVIEGICLVVTGLGFLLFDITRALDLDKELEEKDFKSTKYTIGLILTGIAILGLGTIILFLDGDFKHGIIYIIAGIGLIIYKIDLHKDFSVLTIIAILSVLGSFLGLGIFSMLNAVTVTNIMVTNVSLITFGIGLTIFQIGARTDKNFAIFSGGILQCCGTVLLSGIFIVSGLTHITSAIATVILGFNTNSIFDVIANQYKVESISYIISGIGIFGTIIGLSFGGARGFNKDRNIIAGISDIITGIGFVGLSLSSIEIIFSGELPQRFMLGVFVSIGYILGTVCGVNLIKLGIGTLSNNLKLSGNNFGGVIFGFVGLFIQWFIEGNYLFGIGSILFVVTMIIALIPDLKVRLIILIGYPLFVLSSLFLAGSFIYSGIKILI